MARAAKKRTGQPSKQPSRQPSKPAAKPSGRPLAAAISQAPRLTDRKAAQARLSEWLAEIGKGAVGKALKQLIGDSAKVEALLLGLADGSPYLWELATAEPDRLL